MSSVGSIVSDPRTGAPHLEATRRRSPTRGRRHAAKPRFVRCKPGTVRTKPSHGVAVEPRSTRRPSPCRCSMTTRAPRPCRSPARPPSSTSSACREVLEPSLPTVSMHRSSAPASRFAGKPVLELIRKRRDGTQGCRSRARTRTKQLAARGTPVPTRNQPPETPDGVSGGGGGRDVAVIAIFRYIFARALSGSISSTFDQWSRAPPASPSDSSVIPSWMRAGT